MVKRKNDQELLADMLKRALEQPGVEDLIATYERAEAVYADATITRHAPEYTTSSTDTPLTRRA